ncbi:MAG: D-alanyl-D-alanine carboxypeptidase family protein [Candidatus Nanopelagicales bacterium]
MKALFISLVVVITIGAVPAEASGIIDYCAKKSDSSVRAITEGSCKKSERSLGNSTIEPVGKRPNALHPLMKNRWLAAQRAAKLAGVVLEYSTAFRSLSFQRYLFQQEIKETGSRKEAMKEVLPPKISMHPWGLAIDVKRFNTTDKKRAKWLEKNGYKWGLCRRYDNEFWHFEPRTTPGTKCPARQPDALSAYYESQGK